MPVGASGHVRQANRLLQLPSWGPGERRQAATLLGHLRAYTLTAAPRWRRTLTSTHGDLLDRWDRECTPTDRSAA